MMAAAPTRPLILIVDDIGDNRQMYAEYLEYDGYRVEQAGSGAEAVVFAEEVSPELIVMDLSMPDMDGWEAIRRIRANARTTSIPILVLSGYTLGATQPGPGDTAADAFLTKPCLPEDLAAKIAAMLARRPQPG
jgi:two-component system, cell cycle response regulator DivK